MAKAESEPPLGSASSHENTTCCKKAAAKGSNQRPRPNVAPMSFPAYRSLMADLETSVDGATSNRVFMPNSVVTYALEEFWKNLERSTSAFSLSLPVFSNARSDKVRLRAEKVIRQDEPVDSELIGKSTEATAAWN